MPTLLHVLRTLSLSLWVGAIAFFAFGVAPVAFHLLPTAHEAGLVVGGSLHVLHVLAFSCGVVYVAASLLGLTVHPLSPAALTRGALVVVMLFLTAYSAFSILPRMEVDRAQAGGFIEALSQNAPVRVDFDRLHHMSERVEGSVLLLGLLALVLTSLEPRLDTHTAGR